jgi:hypothetical protein
MNCFIAILTLLRPNFRCRQSLSSFFICARPEIFMNSTINEAEILQLVEDNLLAPRLVLQWRLAKGEDIPTTNTQEIVVMKPYL